MTKQRRAVLVDGDIIAYVAASGAQREVEDDDMTLVDYEGAARIAEYEIDALADRLDASVVVVALTDRMNFRKDIDPTYKANRKGTPKPLALSAVRQHLIVHRAARVKPRLEADDVLGIMATKPDFLGDYEKIIASIDKDLRSIPGRLYNWRRDADGVLEITPAKATGWFLVQTLTGDPVDGFKGCPGVGIKRAIPIIKGKSLAEAWDAIVEAFVARGLTPDDALTQARLARILHHTDYNFSTGTPILWTPPKTKAG